jgi:hypothetical protein
VESFDGPVRIGAVPRRRIDLKLLVASLVIAGGLVLVVAGVRASVTGDEQQNLPEAIQQIEPVRDATQVPNQSKVFVDLVTGYEAALVIDGIELPTVSFDDAAAETPPGGTVGNGAPQLVLPPGAVFEPGNVTLTFNPGDDQLITEFSSGPHTATVLYWKIEDGRNAARTFSWTFYVV